ncbi:MAG TPA: M48 family metallopeptidase [Nocardioidaceae bacterium]|nr:M48 family metallopeptidase [Nocardioidaceae bacterium]
MPASDRRLAWAWFAIAAVALVITIAVTTPWDWLPGGSLAPIDKSGGLSESALDRIDAYRGDIVPIGLASTAVSLVVAIGLGLTSWGARLVRRLPGSRWWALQTLLAVAALLTIGRIVTLPLAIWSQNVRRDFGLATNSWAAWAVDQVITLAVAIVLTALPIVVVLAMARRWRRWWLPASLTAGGLVIIGSFGYPLVVEPLFNNFGEMQDGPLRASLVQMAEADGVDVNDVLVADASKRTSSLNAYVSGFGASKRIVVYDTLLSEASPAEVRLVVAHELGHAKHNDVLHGTIVGALGAVAGVTLLALLLTSRRLAERAGYRADRPGEAVAVPAILALVACGTFLASPVQNLISRAIEARADVHSLDLTHDPATFEATQRRLAQANLSPPWPSRPLYVWFSSHPSLAQRIALAQGWQERESGD